jgi:F-type H+-transporting ATPase subunit delta
VTSSRELNGSQRDQVIEKVRQMTNASGVELQATVDENILGGVIIRVGSQVIDASLRSQLRRISLKLAGAIA